MSWTITPGIKSLDGVPIGTPYGGGFVGGFISWTANSIPTHALIVSPKATGELSSPVSWKTSDTQTPNTKSLIDGVSNTLAMVDAGISSHPAAQFCVNLSIGGFTDWYLPSLYEMLSVYINLKPTFGFDSGQGVNPYSVPRRYSNYVRLDPPRTYVPEFILGGSESFKAEGYWTSSQESNSYPIWAAYFQSGGYNLNGTNAGYLSVRAFRRITL